MIYFRDNESWVQFGQQRLDDPKVIVIDLMGCESKEDFTLAIGKVLYGSYSPKLVTGKSLDALTDVVSDYLIENWLKWKEVYIIGWKYFTDKHPIFSQYMLSSFVNSYIKSLSGELQLVEWGERNFQDLYLLEALTDARPKFFLVLN